MARPSLSPPAAARSNRRPAAELLLQQMDRHQFTVRLRPRMVQQNQRAIIVRHRPQQARRPHDPPRQARGAAQGEAVVAFFRQRRRGRSRSGSASRARPGRSSSECRKSTNPTPPNRRSRRSRSAVGMRDEDRSPDPPSPSSRGRSRRARCGVDHRRRSAGRHREASSRNCRTPDRHRARLRATEPHHRYRAESTGSIG